jgi:pimeloyl-ACP methyl ester carboxylesterase
MFSYEDAYPDPAATAGPSAVQATRACTKILANGVEIYYKEAIPNDSNAVNGETSVLLLHGFPTSSNYFRNLIPLLAARGHRVVAPDLPGFGVTRCPDTSFIFTLQKVAETIVLLIDNLDLGDSLVIYCHGEYGTLVGLRVVQYKLETVTGLIVQNGTAYMESRLKSGLFSEFESRVSLPHAHQSGSLSAGSLSESGRFKPRSCLSSTHSSCSNLGELGSNDGHRLVTLRSRRVSFEPAVEEINIDRDGMMCTRTRSNVFDSESDDSKDESSNSTIYFQDTVCNSPISTSPEMLTPTITFESSSSDNEVDDGLTVDKLKNLYSPSQTISFPGFRKKPDFSHSFSHMLDMHAVLLDYYFLSRPGQPYIQQQLHKDYMHQIRQPSAPASMWLRTTNTPLLILWGTHDPILAQDATLDAFKRDCRFFSCRTFDRAGHFAAEYYPDEIATCIHEFVLNNCRENTW